MKKYQCFGMPFLLLLLATVSVCVGQTVVDVGTHELACCQSFPGGVASNTFWQVRVRIPLPTTATIYCIATMGPNGNTGSINSPFLTLEGPRNYICTHGLPPAARPVYLCDGTHFLPNIL